MDIILPELLSVDELQKCLRQFLKSDQLSDDKYKLVALAHKYLVPAPQRHFRSNRLGTLLSQTQKQSRNEKRVPSSDSHSETQRTDQSSEKHQSDRGIYTIHRQKSATKNTPPIKLKRPVVNSTTDESTAAKRQKTEESPSS